MAIELPRRITPHTSAQISILRPICIFFMLYVHVNPGFDAGIHSGAMLYFGAVVVDILGRTSVAALSLISGFLLAEGVARKSCPTLIWGRVRVLYLPMLVWSAIFIAIALGGAALLGHSTGVSGIILNLPVDRLILEKLMFLHGSPASSALGFLRDLAVSSILLILFLQIPGKAIVWCAMLAVFCIVLFGSMMPVVYRSTIPLFMLAGAAFYRGPGNLHIPSIYVKASVFLFGALVLDCLTSLDDKSMLSVVLGNDVTNVAKRAILTVLALALSSLLVTTQTGTWLRRNSDGVFLAYLSHTIVISILWALWNHGVGNETHWTYIVFFISSPALTMALAIYIDPRLCCLPHPIQVGLRGKARSNLQSI